MIENRMLIFPEAMGFGAVPVEVPGRGNVLSCSAILPFRLSDGERIRPQLWYEAVSKVSPTAVPDTLMPLSNTEVVFLGPLPPVTGRSREAYLLCGSLQSSYIFYPDVNAEKPVPWEPEPEAAVWHKDKNPVGRGGPNDSRRPLIVSKADPQNPVWLCPTPHMHPERMRRAGVSAEGDGAGWFADTDSTVFNEAHPSLWIAEGLRNADPLVLEGFSDNRIHINLPPYRVAVATIGVQNIDLQICRIHTVMLIPAAGLGAAIWRAAVDLRKADVLGGDVIAVVAGLEDKDEKPSPLDRWFQVFDDRYDNTRKAVDDRPLLPPSITAAMPAPYAAVQDDAEFKERYEAAQEWFKQESNMPDKNPYDDPSFMPEEVKEASEKVGLDTEVDPETGPKSMNEIDKSAMSVFEKNRERHEKAGFKDPDPEEHKKPVVRGEEELQAEIPLRLSGPFRSLRERQIIENTGAGYLNKDYLESVLVRLVEPRLISPESISFWPILDEEQGKKFGEGLVERLVEGEPLKKYIDVSCAIVVLANLSGISFDHLLAENTQWRDTEFRQVKMYKSTFVGGRFENCTFTNCEFDRVNLSNVHLVNCRFDNCRFSELNTEELNWRDVKCVHCELVNLSLISCNGYNMRFEHCKLHDLQWTDSVLEKPEFVGTEMRNVTLVQCLMVNSLYERVTMFKVWGMGRGMTLARFDQVVARTCGFVSMFRFDHASFSRVRFVGTGFTNVLFTHAQIDPGCIFDECDLTGSGFYETQATAVRFLGCGMTASSWIKVNAVDTWFYGAVLSGSFFDDETELAGAVFAESNVSGVHFYPEKTIGADFTGTTRDAES